MWEDEIGGFGGSSKKGGRDLEQRVRAQRDMWSTAGFCWTGPTPHDLSSGRIELPSGRGKLDIPAKAANVLRAGETRDTRCTSGIGGRAVKQAGCELGGPSCELPGFAHGSMRRWPRLWRIRRGPRHAVWVGRRLATIPLPFPIGCAPHCVCLEGTSEYPWCAIFAPPSRRTVPILASRPVSLAKGRCAFERFDAVAA